MEYVPVVLATIMIVALFGLFIYIGINDKKWKKHEKEIKEKEAQREANPERKEIKATVISKRILDSYEGFLVSRYVLDFLVAFRIENETVEFSVTQQFFDKVNKDDKGTLITINDELYDFIKE